MHRRLTMRRQMMLLLISLRLGYGGTILSLLISQAAMLSENTLIVLILSMAVAALLLDTLMFITWPLVASQRAEQFCCRVPLLQPNHLIRLRCHLMQACAVANHYRHWFYLPAAFASLFVIPDNGTLHATMAVWIWLFAFGITAALVEGVVNNERNRQ